MGLELAAKYYGVDPMEVIQSRLSGISFASIHGGLYREQHPVKAPRVKAAPEEGEDMVALNRPNQGKAKGKGKSDGSKQ